MSVYLCALDSVCKPARLLTVQKTDQCVLSPFPTPCKKSQNQLTQVGKSERRGGQGKMNEKREEEKREKNAVK